MYNINNVTIHLAFTKESLNKIFQDRRKYSTQIIEYPKYRGDQVHYFNNLKNRIHPCIRQ